MAGTTNMPDLRTRLTLDITDFTRGLVSARSQASLFGNEIQSVGGHFKTAGVAMATFATIALFTAGIVVTSFMAAIGVLMTLGAVSAMQAESVQIAWGQTGEHLRTGMLEASRAYIPVLERLASKTIQVFDSVMPALTAVFDRLAPLFEDLSVSFLGWFGDLINRLPSMVNNAIAFLFLIGPAWDQATDNMRAGWNEMYQAILSFGPALMTDGLPAFGAFVGAVLSLLAPIVEAASQFAGPFFAMLAMVVGAAQDTFGAILLGITPELISVANVMGTLGISIVQMFAGADEPMSDLLNHLVTFGEYASTIFDGMGPSVIGFLQAVANTGGELLPILAALAPFVIGLGPVMVALGNMVTAMARGFVLGIKPLLDAMSIDWSGDLVEGIVLLTPLMEQLAFFTGTFVTALVHGIGMLMDFITPLVAGLSGLTSMFGSAGEQAGTALVVGIIAGLGFMVSPLVGVMAGLVAAVAAFLPRSPAEVGPLSGDGSPDQRGFKLGSMFAEGLAASTDLVRAAAGGLVGSINLPDNPNAIGSSTMAMPNLQNGGGEVTNVTVNVAGNVQTEKDLIAAIKESMLVREARNAGSIFATSLRGS